MKLRFSTVKNRNWNFCVDIEKWGKENIVQKWLNRTKTSKTFLIDINSRTYSNEANLTRALK